MALDHVVDLVTRRDERDVDEAGVGALVGRGIVFQVLRDLSLELAPIRVVVQPERDVRAALDAVLA